MKAQHTPGPWSSFGPGSPTIYGGDPQRRICVLDRMTGAELIEDYANARLIAAAPDLLAALRKLDRLHRGLDAWHADADADAWANARAVLAQATGAES